MEQIVTVTKTKEIRMSINTEKKLVIKWLTRRTREKAQGSEEQGLRHAVDLPSAERGHQPVALGHFSLSF